MMGVGLILPGAGAGGAGGPTVKVATLGLVPLEGNLATFVAETDDVYFEEGLNVSTARFAQVDDDDIVPSSGRDDSVLVAGAGLWVVTAVVLNGQPESVNGDLLCPFFVKTWVDDEFVDTLIETTLSTQWGSGEGAYLHASTSFWYEGEVLVGFGLAYGGSGAETGWVVPVAQVTVTILEF